MTSSKSENANPPSSLPPRLTDERVEAAATEAREAILDGLRRLSLDSGEDIAQGVDEFTDDEYLEVARFALAAADAVDPLRQTHTMGAEILRLRERETALMEERGLFEATAAVAEAKVRELAARETALTAANEKLRERVQVLFADSSEVPRLHEVIQNYETRLRNERAEHDTLIKMWTCEVCELPITPTRMVHEHCE